MRLYVETMDTSVVDFDSDGRVRFEDEDWQRLTLQERRAVLYSAKQEIERLSELIEVLEREPPDPC
jgi:predicted Fe-S protein YdhL (DUF1289 family)